MTLFRKSETLLSQEEITLWLRELRGHPFNLSSKFDVTSIFRVKFNGEDNYYFAGVNVENPDHRLSTHGEEGCIAAMTTAFGKSAEIIEGWVMGAPRDLTENSDSPMADIKVTCCGKCRQQIIGFANDDVKIHSISLKGEHQQTTVAEFLPEAFSFKQFAPDALQPSMLTGKAMLVPEIYNRLIRSDISLSEDDIFFWMKELESVDHASQTGQVVVLKLTDNHYVAGVNVEDAAYVGINAVQSAIAIARVAFKDFKVEEVWSFSQAKIEPELNVCQPSTSTAPSEVVHQFKSFKKADKIKLDTFMPLSLSAIQVLGQFAAHRAVPIHMFNERGAMQSYPMNESANLIPLFPEIKEMDMPKLSRHTVMG